MINSRMFKINSAFVETTSICNLHCLHCYNDSGLDDKCIDFRTFEKIIRDLSYLGANRVSISGGEPLLHPQFTDIMNLLQEYPIKYQLITNGTKIYDRLALISNFKNNVVIQISIDGIGDDHDKIRGRGIFDIVDQNIRLLHANNIKFYFKTTINKYNYQSLEEILQYSINNGAMSISFSFVNPIGRGLINKQLHLSDNDILTAFESLRLLKGKYENKIAIEIPNIYRNGICPWFNYSKETTLKISPRIDVNGNVFLCSAFMNPKFSIGNAKINSLKDILLENNEVIDLLDFLRLSKKYIDCPRCVINSSCNRGCPASYWDKLPIYDDNFCGARKIAFLRDICMKEGIEM